MNLTAQQFSKVVEGIKMSQSFLGLPFDSLDENPEPPLNLNSTFSSATDIEDHSNSSANSDIDEESTINEKPTKKRKKNERTHEIKWATSKKVKMDDDNVSKKSVMPILEKMVRKKNILLGEIFAEKIVLYKGKESLFKSFNFKRRKFCIDLDGENKYAEAGELFFKPEENKTYLVRYKNEVYIWATILSEKSANQTGRNLNCREIDLYWEELDTKETIKKLHLEALLAIEKGAPIVEKLNSFKIKVPDKETNSEKTINAYRLLHPIT